MATFHMILQGKGGVGKTFIASLLTQALKRHMKLLCLDTDSVNHTFSQYQDYNVVEFDIYDKNTSEMNPTQFDNMVEYLVNEDKTTVIDNGASSFVPLTNYIIENQLFDFLQNMGHEIIIHTIITGGQGMADTVNGLQSLIENTPEQTKIVVWLNNHFGDIVYNGKTFTDLPIYKKNSDKLLAIIPLEFKKSQLFQDDLSFMATNKYTFDQAIEHSRLMSGTRLKIMQEEIFSLIDAALEIYPKELETE